MRRRWLETLFRRSSRDTECDELIDWYLHDLVAGEEPAPETWDKIRAGLGGGPPAFPARPPAEAPSVPLLARFLGYATVALAAVSIVLNIGAALPQPAAVVEPVSPASASLAPVVSSQADALTARLAFLSEQEQRTVRADLSPAGDPVLIHRRLNQSRASRPAADES